jgi:hypothetical protein
VLSLVIGVPATRVYGLWGAILGVNVSDGVSWLMLVFLLRRKTADLRVASQAVADAKAEEMAVG